MQGFALFNFLWYPLAMTPLAPIEFLICHISGEMLFLASYLLHVANMTINSLSLTDIHNNTVYARQENTF